MYIIAYDFWLNVLATVNKQWKIIYWVETTGCKECTLVFWCDCFDDYEKLSYIGLVRKGHLLQ